MKGPFTIWLEERDVSRLREKAVSMGLPPHVYARSIVLQGLNVSRCQDGQTAELRER